MRNLPPTGQAPLENAILSTCLEKTPEARRFPRREGRGLMEAGDRRCGRGSMWNSWLGLVGVSRGFW